MEQMIFEHWLSAAVAVFLIAMMLYGHYRGFLKQCISIGALVITLAIVKFASPYITEALSENTQIQEAVSDLVLETIGMHETNEETLNEPSAQRLIIEGLELPENIKEALIANNNGEVYRLLGVERFAQYVGAYVANIILNWLSSAILFILVFVGLQLLVRWLDLLARLPLIYGLNKIAGTFLGLAQGLLILWVAALVLELFSATPAGRLLMDQVNQSLWLSALYHFNLVGFFLQGLIRGAF